jgi:hypothetical protein
MKRMLALVVALHWGCSSQPSLPADSAQATAAQTSPESIPSTTHGAHSADTAASTGSPSDSGNALDASRIASDVSLIVGGNFAVDHIGPEAYDAVVKRFESAPSAYVAESVAQAKGFSRARLSGSYVEALLTRAKPLAPGAVRSAATELLPIYRSAESASVKAPSDPSEPSRLQERVRDLESLIR